MKFELLPNETIYKCFEYLDALEIFYSFDQLNARFNQLIRTTPLYLHLQYAQKAIFDQFCEKMQSDSQIKNQIYSLKFSQENSCDSLENFLRNFPLEQFTHLRSLILIKISRQILDQLTTIVPKLSELSRFDFIEPDPEQQHILINLGNLNLKSLSVPSSICKITSNDYTLPIRSLMISYCQLAKLLQVFKYAPMLKSLRINGLSHSTIAGDCQAVHLKYLMINGCRCDFKDLEILFKQTKNLKYLTLCDKDHDEIYDGNQWEDIITSLLPHLISFKFNFLSHSRVQILKKFKRFQNPFWSKHGWYTEYILFNDMIQIYTIPYILDSYALKPFTSRHSNQINQTSNTFDSVTNLEYALVAKSDVYFRCVSTLKLESVLPNDDYIESLKTSIHLSNLKHLDIQNNDTLTLSFVLLNILKQAPQLSSITIDSKHLVLFNNDELCQYVNKMITKVNIHDSNRTSFENVEQMELFSKIFSNIEQLVCYIYQKDHLLFLLKHLSKLSYIKILRLVFDSVNHCSSWFEEQGLKQYITLYHQHGSMGDQVLQIWINKDNKV